MKTTQGFEFKKKKKLPQFSLLNALCIVKKCGKFLSHCQEFRPARAFGRGRPAGGRGRGAASSGFDFPASFFVTSDMPRTGNQVQLPQIAQDDQQGLEVYCFGPPGIFFLTAEVQMINGKGEV